MVVMQTTLKQKIKKLHVQMQPNNVIFLGLTENRDSVNA